MEGIAGGRYEGDRDDDNPRQHHQRLKYVGPRHGEKTSEEGIGDHREQGDHNPEVMAAAGMVEVEDVL